MILATAYAADIFVLFWNYEWLVSLSKELWQSIRLPLETSWGHGSLLYRLPLT